MQSNLKHQNNLPQISGYLNSYCCDLSSSELTKVAYEFTCRPHKIPSELFDFRKESDGMQSLKNLINDQLLRQEKYNKGQVELVDKVESQLMLSYDAILLELNRRLLTAEEGNNAANEFHSFPYLNKDAETSLKLLIYNSLLFVVLRTSVKVGEPLKLIHIDILVKIYLNLKEKKKISQKMETLLQNIMLSFKSGSKIFHLMLYSPF